MEEPYANIKEANRISKIEYGKNWKNLSCTEKQKINKILWQLGE